MHLQAYTLYQSLARRLLGCEDDADAVIASAWASANALPA